MYQPPTTWTEARARIAAAVRDHRPETEIAELRRDLRELRRPLREAKAEQYIRQLLAETPPLSAEERLHLTRLLTEPDRAAS